MFYDLIIKFKTLFSKKGGTNDCSTCQGGSSGTCYADAFDCSFIADFIVGQCGKSIAEAGAEGCSTCTEFRKPTLCPTTCNWCTDMSKTTTTSTTSTTTTTTTTTENTRTNDKSRIFDSLNMMKTNMLKTFLFQSYQY